MCSWDLHVTSSAHRIKIYSVNKSRPETQARLKQLEENGQPFEPLTQPLEFAVEDMSDFLATRRKVPREPLN
jgi:sulfite oxidase